MRPLVAALAAGILALSPDSAYLDHNGATLPFLPSPVMQQTMQQGYVTYGLDQGASTYPGFAAQVAEVADAGTVGVGIPAWQSSSPDIWLTMPDDQTFISVCGQGAAGCILYWADPVIVLYRRALGYSSWRSTIAHEGINYGHAMGEHEQYDDAAFRCRSIADLVANGPGLTVMSCGTGIWQPQAFDVETVHSVVLPQWHNGGRLVGNTLYYGGSDARTTRVAIVLQTYLGYQFFSGTYAPAVRGCVAIVCGSVQLPSTWRCMGVWIGHENALPVSFGREMQYVGWTDGCY